MIIINMLQLKNVIRSKHFTARLAKANLAIKNDTFDLVKMTGFKKRLIKSTIKSSSNINKRINKNFDK